MIKGLQRHGQRLKGVGAVGKIGKLMDGVFESRGEMLETRSIDEKRRDGEVSFPFGEHGVVGRSDASDERFAPTTVTHPDRS